MVLSDLAQSIANRYTGPEAAEYQAAAKVLRLPYWDWGSDPRVPPATTEEFVEVNTWEGRQRIRNPLFSYRFQKPVDRKLLGNPKPAAPGLDFTETFRCPDGSGQSHPIWANDRLLDEPFRDEVVCVTIHLTQRAAGLVSIRHFVLTLALRHSTLCSPKQETL